MKNKIILVIVLLFTISASAQVNLGMSLGVGKSTPVFVLNVGYSFNPELINSERVAPEIQYDQRFYLSRRVDRPAYLGVKLGASYQISDDDMKLWFLTGPSYRLASNDNKSLNYWTYGYGVRFTMPTFGVELYRINNATHLTVGFYYTFERD